VEIEPRDLAGQALRNARARVQRGRRLAAAAAARLAQRVHLGRQLLHLRSATARLRSTNIYSAPSVALCGRTEASGAARSASLLRPARPALHGPPPRRCRARRAAPRSAGALQAAPVCSDGTAGMQHGRVML